MRIRIIAAYRLVPALGDDLIILNDNRTDRYFARFFRIAREFQRPAHITDMLIFRVHI